MKNKAHFLIILFLPFAFQAQDICTGNLGENIFAIGDFGSGAATVVLTDPGIAPGYLYTTVPPPPDGRYVITNDMNRSAWDAVYPTWLRIKDNSEDPDGYMMVVNASFEPGIFYEEEVTGLCENTLYEFSADVINLIRAPVTGHIEPNLSFLLDDVVQYTSGNIPQDEAWHKQGFTFVTSPGQTTVKLTLRNNAPGGIGNDLALDNISFRPCGPSAFANASQDQVICSNDLDPVSILADTEAGAAIQWQFYNEASAEWEDIPNENDTEIFHTNFEPGFYQYRYLTAGIASNLQNEKCRVISDLASVTVLPIEFTVYDTICENVSYSFGDQIITTPGFYEATFLASTGCDSFVDLFLEHVPDPNMSVDFILTDPLCFGDTTGRIEINEVIGGVMPYTFYLDGMNANTSISGLSANSYTILIEDRFQCFVQEEVDLANPDIFTVDIGEDTTVEFGVTYQFLLDSNEPIISGIWAGEELECTSCIENAARPFTSGIYTFTGSNGNGCLASDSIRINVGELEELFYKPNIFSPNEDGFNDQFRILTGSQAVEEIEEFRVFDRYGNLVHIYNNADFYTNEHAWDGLFNGNPASTGVYTYYYLLRLIDQSSITVKGDFTLVR